MKLSPLEKKLATALKHAKEHLDYCGYGDKWERECAEAMFKGKGLEAHIDAALEAVEQQSNRLKNLEK